MRYQVSRSVLVYSLLFWLKQPQLRVSAIAGTATATEELDSTTSKLNEIDNEDGDFDMEKMSKAELESICRTRGFELVNETDTSGNLIEYLHHDNIEAAQQCLAIEAEM